MRDHYLNPVPLGLLLPYKDQIGSTRAMLSQKRDRHMMLQNNAVVGTCIEIWKLSYHCSRSVLNQSNL